MEKLDHEIIAGLDQEYGEGHIWDVLPARWQMIAPEVCGEYPTVRAAFEAVKQAGFEPSGKPLALRSSAPAYDKRTVMRFEHRDGSAFGQVAIARRAE